MQFEKIKSLERSDGLE